MFVSDIMLEIFLADVCRNEEPRELLADELPKLMLLALGHQIQASKKT